MEELILQIRKALDEEMFYLALFATLTLPDICGALETDGRATSAKYIKWFDIYVSVKFGNKVIRGDDIWKYRCSFFHQGLSKHKHSRYERIIFKEPILSRNIIFKDPQKVGPPEKKKVLILELKTFCENVLTSAEEWYSKIKKIPNFKSNYAQLMQRRPLDDFNIHGIYGFT